MGSSNVLTELPSHFTKPTTPLMEAAVEGNVDKVKALLAGGEEVNTYTEDGFSALIYACVMGSAPVVDALLAAGAELNPPPGKHTPIRGAGNYGHVEISKKLLAAGADINIASAGDRTPIMGVAMNGHLELVHLFIAAGAKLDAKNDFGETALDLATAKGHAPVAEALQAALGMHAYGNS